MVRTCSCRPAAFMSCVLTGLCGASVPDSDKRSWMPRTPRNWFLLAPIAHLRWSVGLPQPVRAGVPSRAMVSLVTTRHSTPERCRAARSCGLGASGSATRSKFDVVTSPRTCASTCCLRRPPHAWSPIGLSDLFQPSNRRDNLFAKKIGKSSTDPHLFPRLMSSTSSARSQYIKSGSVTAARHAHAARRPLA